MNISSLQFAIFYRSYFLDYKKYARELCELFLEDTPEINDVKNIDSAPCDYILYALEDKSNYKISITKQRTDLLYMPKEKIPLHDEYIDIFVNKVKSCVEKFITPTNLCSRIGFINSSYLSIEEPNAHVVDHFYKDEFNKNATDINMSFNIRDNFKDFEVNKVFSLIAIKNQQQDDSMLSNIVSVNYDINTRGMKESMPQKFIFDFIDNYSKEFTKEHMESMTYGKL